MKATNAAHKKFLKDPASLETAPIPERYKQIVRSYKQEYSWLPHPFSGGTTSNAANIRTVKERIALLENRSTDETQEETIGAATIVDNVEENRVQILFPGKPAEEIRTLLKQNGFRWSPSNGAWQMHRSPMALHRAREIASRL